MNYLLAFFIALIVIGTPRGLVYGQETSLALSPPLSRMAIQPGRTATITYTLENSGDPAFIVFRIRPISSKDSAGSIIIEENSTDPIKFIYQVDGQNRTTEEAVFMKSREQKKVRVNIEVPAETPTKDYYYALLAEVQAPPEIEGTTSVRVKVTTVSYLLMTVTQSGQIESAAKIVNFSATSARKPGIFGKNKRIFESNTTIDLNLLMANTGKNVIYPRGTIEVRGLLGGHLTYEIPPQIVLAGAQRKFSMTLPKFFMGSYKIAANVTLGEGAPVVFAQTSVIVFPFKMAGMIAIIGVGVFLVKLRKKIPHKHHD